jgi:ATP-dependent RNA helicase DeaD
MKFAELNLKPQVMRALKEKGYEDMTPVQEKTYSVITTGKDIIAKAETGSGKTAACAVPIVQSVDASKKTIQALVLVPTRELALQYVSEISSIAKHTDIAPFAVYGGFPMDIQLSKLEHGVHILVATPGRLIDMLYNTSLTLSDVQTFVLDEADEMLNMGFVTDVEFVISCLVHDHQTLLFSATMPAAIQRLATKYLKETITIDLNTDQVAPQNLEHHFKQVNRSNHFDSLEEYLESQKKKFKQGIVFCNSRTGCDKLFRELKKNFKSVEIIHGGLDQSRRTSLFNRFKRKDISLMIATDVAARGLDFSGATHVINYDFPKVLESYTHRTGRTARMGREGVAMTFVTRNDLGEVKKLIQVNQINPFWDGEAPDMSKVTSRKKTGGWKGRGKNSSRPQSNRKGPAKPKQS